MHFEFLEITTIVLLAVVVLLLKTSGGRLEPRSAPQPELRQQPRQQRLERGEDPVAALPEDLL